MSQELGTLAGKCLLSPKAGTSFPPLSAALQRRTRVAFYFSPSPFATQSLALASAPCGRRCPIIIVSAPAIQAQTMEPKFGQYCNVGATWRGGHAHTSESVTISNQSSSPVRGKRKSRRSGYAMAHKPPGALGSSLGGAASPRLMEHKNILI